MTHCPMCLGAREPGWLCEEHPNRPWAHDGCDGVGVPCPCNPEGEVQLPEVFVDCDGGLHFEAKVDDGAQRAS